MNTSQIQRILRCHPRTSGIFLGVFASDQLPSYSINPPCALVCNTDPSDKPGEHWIAIYINSSGCGEYFDSYGQEPSIVTIRSFLNRNTMSYRTNIKTIQGAMSSSCGQYCVYYLLYRCCGKSLEQIVRSMPSNPFVSDSFVVAFVNKHCRLSTEIVFSFWFGPIRTVLN